MFVLGIFVSFFCLVTCIQHDIGFNLDIDEVATAGTPFQGFDQKSILNGNSTGLQEFVPIRNSILQSETQYYSFSVNTSSGLGIYYQFLIFLTGNICSQPDNVVANETSIAVYYSFNSTMFDNFEIADMSLFDNGYFQALADVPAKNKTGSPETDESEILYIAVRAPENTNRTAQWTYQIGVSQNDLVFQWDDRSWALVVDTDASSALIVTGNLTGSPDIGSLNATVSQYSLYVYSYDYRDYFSLLNSSWCAIRNGPALIRPDAIETSYTSRLGSLQQQFYVHGLNSSTTYIGYLLSDFNGTDLGGAVYQPFEFETLSDDSCELIFDLQFCDKVSYSVPSAQGMSKEQLAQLYDTQALKLYGNFSKGLQQIACNTTDVAEYSPLRTCANCNESYIDWLCSVTIPRCSTRNETGYMYRDVNASRNDFINEVIQPSKPYYEVLPCIDTCNAIVRDCPSQFGFMCPTRNESIALSYYWYYPNQQWPSCNYCGRAPTSGGGRTAYINYMLLCTTIFFSFFVL